MRQYKVPDCSLTPEGRSKLLRILLNAASNRKETHASMSTDSCDKVDGEGLGSSPGPIMLMENFKYPLVPAAVSSGSVSSNHL